MVEMKAVTLILLLSSLESSGQICKAKFSMSCQLNLDFIITVVMFIISADVDGVK